jgi:hypothetical protein
LVTLSIKLLGVDSGVAEFGVFASAVGEPVGYKIESFDVGLAFNPEVLAFDSGSIRYLSGFSAFADTSNAPNGRVQFGGCGLA